MGTLNKLGLVKGKTDQKHWELSKRLRQTEAWLRQTNLCLRHVGRYHSNKKVYARYQQAEDKPLFRAEHRSEIEAYEESLKVLAKYFPDSCYPSLKELREEKENLTHRRDALKAEFKLLSAEQRNLWIVWKNVQSILGTRGMEVPEEQREHREQERVQPQCRRKSEPSL